MNKGTEYDLVLLDQGLEKKTLQKIDKITGPLPQIGTIFHYSGPARQYKVLDVIYHTERISDVPTSGSRVSYIEVIVTGLH
jgi:hypothetical protein